MTSEYTLIWSFRNRIAELKDSVESADKYTSKDMKFLLIDANSDYYNIKWIHDICNNIKEREIRICETHYRTTLPEAWNLGMMLSDTRYCIFASSDVTFHRYSWYIRLIGKYDYVLMPNHAVFALDKAISSSRSTWPTDPDSMAISLPYMRRYSLPRTSKFIWDINPPASARRILF